VVAHNANYDSDQTFRLPGAKWIDGLCARNLSWLPSIRQDGETVNLPPYSSVIIGEYEWGQP